MAEKEQISVPVFLTFMVLSLVAGAMVGFVATLIYFGEHGWTL